MDFYLPIELSLPLRKYRALLPSRRDSPSHSLFQISRNVTSVKYLFAHE